MKVANVLVSTVLRSPLHRLLSESTDLIRYTGRRSGRVVTTPTQYASCGEDLVILVGRADRKKWWRNFGTDQDVDVLLRGKWTPMTARAVVGSAQPETVAPLVRAYVNRFPKVARGVGGGTIETELEHAVVVRCRPRTERPRAVR